MEMWFEYLKENWLFFLIALIVLFVVVSFVKTMIKWALVVVIIAAVAVYGGFTWDDVNQVVTTVKDETVQKLKEQAIQAMVEEAEKAKFTANENGTYTISTSSLELTGKPNSGKVGVTFGGVSLGEWELNEAVREFIQTAKQNK
ncbi:ATPase [Paenibacillus sp. 481]|uniref:ATPase n=1 Tax=Paenibacillus sp. 481 TaxID=2835869 RepID=UPI001E3AFF3F|nr:ATPase [Paenibacillus sp. 481]